LFQGSNSEGQTQPSWWRLADRKAVSSSQLGALLSLGSAPVLCGRCGCGFGFGVACSFRPRGSRVDAHGGTHRQRAACISAPRRWQCRVRARALTRAITTKRLVAGTGWRSGGPPHAGAMRAFMLCVRAGIYPSARCYAVNGAVGECDGGCRRMQTLVGS